ncbi:hypothetical protein [Streptomyces sp. DH37]|uniref:hypothetical protein n=1 Tax=Streptomyces sp. DH37 TaxID=3040122 RepID=UPI00244260F4|nr:hypothetical protein [Streptomyces sp. DH37]MDG9701850.1 hypothetical protein [Streptomyces sp. DH37]
MLERLDRAAEHIGRNPDQPTDTAGLARIALRPEHRLRRLAPAPAGMGLSGERTPLDVAVRCGCGYGCDYDHGPGEAFARAFRAARGVGPGEAGRTGAAPHPQPPMSFRLAVQGGVGMRYRVVEEGEFGVVGRRARVPPVHEGPDPAIVGSGRSADRETAALRHPWRDVFTRWFPSSPYRGLRVPSPARVPARAPARIPGRCAGAVRDAG